MKSQDTFAVLLACLFTTPAWTQDLAGFVGGGVGGHGARPQEVKDPIVMAGEFIVELQTIVSRQENPRDPTVVTVGDIHGGTKRNIVPDEVKMELKLAIIAPLAIETVPAARKLVSWSAIARSGVPKRS